MTKSVSVLGPKFQSFLLYDPKITLNSKRSNVPYVCVTTVKIPNFSHPVCSTTSRFGVTGHSETNAPNDPKLTFNTKRSKVHVPHICITYYVLVPNVTPFRSRSSRFRFTGHFETSVPNYLKLALNPTKRKVSRICVTTVPESKVSVRLLYDQPFSRYKVANNQKCTN